MNKKLSILASLLVVAMLAFSMSTVFAKKPIPVSGTTTAMFIPNIVKVAGGNTFMEHTGTGVWTGDTAKDITGTTIAYHNWHMNKDGYVNMKIELTLTGTVNGKSGTLNILCLIRMPPTFDGTGTWTIISGTGGLANLHGTGTFGKGWYEGQVNFDP